MDRFAARSMLAKSLLKDADRHRRHCFADIGSEYENTEARLRKNPDGFDPLVGVALNFWFCWIDERNHGFPGFHHKIRKELWPMLAEQLALCLDGRETGSMPSLLKSFRVRYRMPLFIRFKRRLRGSKGPKLAA